VAAAMGEKVVVAVRKVRDMIGVPDQMISGVVVVVAEVAERNRLG
jgi:hypothetical protein